MKYDYIYKMNCVEMYHKGQWPDTPNGLVQKDFRKMIKRWAKLEELHGYDVLKHPATCREYTAEYRYQLVAKVLAGTPQRQVALEAGINDSQLSNWVKQYKIYGYSGLNLKKGRPSKDIPMKKNIDKLTPSEREELIRLRAETEYLKAENEAIKKQIALRHEKWAAQLKVKKQQSSKNSEKKDIN